MQKVTPSPEATKHFVVEELPKIMLDLQRKGKLPPGYGGVKEKEVAGK